MSGNASRKHKQYQMMKENRRLFGDISPRDENGRLDLIAYSAAQGRIITSSAKYDLSKVPNKSKKRKSRAL